MTAESIQNIQYVTLEIIIKKFKKSDLSTFPNIFSYKTKLEPILWILWVIKEKFRIDAYIPASMIADILVDGIGKSADAKSVKKALARAGKKIHRRIVDVEPVYKIMVDGINHLKKLEGKKIKEKIYPPGTQYDLYKDLKNIVQKASNEVFIIDAYPDDSLYYLYIDSISKKAKVRILTKYPPMKFVEIGKLLAQKRPLAIAINSQIHDRYIFVDKRCWMLGSSIKSAAKSKPTTLVELVTGRKELYSMHDNFFKKGKLLS